MRIFLGILFVVIALGGFWAWTIWSVYLAGGESIIEEPGTDAPIETVRLDDGFNVLIGAGGNITVSVGRDGVLVVDTGYASMSPGVVAAIRALSDAAVIRIINTHSHGDHAGGNSAVAAEGADIIAHTNAKTEMTKLLGSEFTTADLPTFVFEERHSLEFNGQNIELIHAPGAHSNSDVVVVFQPANLIAAGDTLVTSGLPYLALELGASLDGHLAAQDLLLALSDEETRLVPGHGSVAGLVELIEVNRDLWRVRDRLAWLKDMGVPRQLRILFHPLRGWPKDRQEEGDWEKYWTSHAWDSLP